MPNMSDVLIEPKILSVIPGETVQTTATVKNSGNSVSQFTFRIDGLDPAWYHLPVSSVTLFPNDEEKLQITFHPPRTGKVTPGLYNCHLIIISQENPGNPEDISLAIEVKAIPEIKLEITPEQIIGKRGVSRIIARNEGESSVMLQLQVTNHDAVLRVNLSPAELSVPGIGTAEANLEAKLKWPHIFHRKKRYDFTVMARQTGSDEMKTVNGQLLKSAEKIPVPVEPLSRSQQIRPNLKLPEITRFEAVTENNRKYSLIWVVERADEVRLEDIKVGYNGDSEVTPVKPTSYTLTASNKHGTINRTINIEPHPIPSEKLSDRISALIEPNQLKVAAGAEIIEATLEIQNTGTIVDKFSLEIEGLAGNWYHFSSPSVALMPHAKEQVQVSFHPPKVPGVKSGSYPFAVILRSQSIPQDSASITAQLEVLPSVAYGISVKPYRKLCRRKCTLQIQISNKDVSDSVLFLDITDIENGLRFRVENDSPVVPPWQTVDIPMIARPRRNSIIGDLKRYDVSVTATTAEGLMQLARCQIDHKPLLSSWRPVLRTIKYVLIISVIGLVVYYIIRLGGGWSSLVRDPQTWLDGTIRHIRGWFY
jgi:hypothetical protein